MSRDLPTHPDLYTLTKFLVGGSTSAALCSKPDESSMQPYKEFWKHGLLSGSADTSVTSEVVLKLGTALERSDEESMFTPNKVWFCESAVQFSDSNEPSFPGNGGKDAELAKEFTCGTANFGSQDCCCISFITGGLILEKFITLALLSDPKEPKTFCIQVGAKDVDRVVVESG